MSIAILKGLLAPIVKDDVNFVNAQGVAKERGIKVTESTQSMVEDYVESDHRPGGDRGGRSIRCPGLFSGRSDARIVMINNFRLEMIPEGHLGSDSECGHAGIHR